MSAGRLDLRSLLFWSRESPQAQKLATSSRRSRQAQSADLVLELTARLLPRTAADKTVGLNNAKLLSAWLRACQRALRYLQGNLWLQIWFTAASHQPTAWM